ncbi:hypothetical protein Moror_1092 [Moniliophthora roreri MCA 2997]|uniref:ceramidase n=1 Tax=Moniliophthora roreri (strain MCA 2997) TaxID=1381753 RepID=V2XK10_MONRO|nr:hypothetical protein Moror_1092 [Moniliophthora roreri MCA 2997]KAI3598550.1 hypothetical protein WG66_017092 [Moniliophthora roreri]
MASQTRSRSRLPKPIFRIPDPLQPPLYRIDLSLPPKERYAEVCNDYRTELLQLAPLYDEILDITPFPRLFKAAAKLLLRHVYSKEESEEIEGISEATGIPKHLVIALNTFLDLFSGCVSGGARVVDTGPTGTTTGIVHFRNLDWGMDVLRSLTICVEYVRGDVVIARGITYAGYIGVLTGVREGLSISLNYRPTLASTSSKFSLLSHYLLLLLGRRPSNSSLLRNLLLSPNPSPASLSALETELTSFPGSPCYLTFCTPDTIIVIERGLKSSVIHTSNTFLAVTNHDVEMESWSSETWDRLIGKQRHVEGDAGLTGTRDLVTDSIERKGCVCSSWNRQSGSRLTSKDVVGWLEVKPVLNECTHYSCAMDPSVPGGGLLWVRRYDEPVDMSSSQD